MAEQLPTSENPELLRLSQRSEFLGGLSCAAMPYTNVHDGPVMLIFGRSGYKHGMSSVIAAPGTRIWPDNDKTELGKWRLRQTPSYGVEPETVSASLTEIVTALPGEIADWAARTQRKLIDELKADQATTASQNGNGILIEKLEAELADADK